MIDAGACTKFVDDMQVTLDIAPKPVRAMRELQFSIQLARGTAPVRHAEVVVDLTMPGMNMGENKVRLRGAGDGTYRGTGIIVRCSSGKTLWKASVAVKDGQRVIVADYLFDAP